MFLNNLLVNPTELGEILYGVTVPLWNQWELEPAYWLDRVSPWRERTHLYRLYFQVGTTSKSLTAAHLGRMHAPMGTACLPTQWHSGLCV